VFQSFSPVTTEYRPWPIDEFHAPPEWNSQPSWGNDSFQQSQSCSYNQFDDSFSVRPYNQQRSLSIPPFYGQGMSSSFQQPTGNYLNPQQSSGTISFSLSFLSAIKKRSSSRANFAANLVCEEFSERVRATSNVAEKCGKQQLDRIKIKEIQNAVFLMYPLEPGENQKLAWKKCHVAIDESCRGLNRSTQ